VAAEPRNHRFANFANFPEKTELPEKFEIPATRGFELRGKTRKKRILASLANPHS